MHWESPRTSADTPLLARHVSEDHEASFYHSTDHAIDANNPTHANGGPCSQSAPDSPLTPSSPPSVHVPSPLVDPRYAFPKISFTSPHIPTRRPAAPPDFDALSQTETEIDTDSESPESVAHRRLVRLKEMPFLIGSFAQIYCTLLLHRAIAVPFYFVAHPPERMTSAYHYDDTHVVMTLKMGQKGLLAGALALDAVVNMAVCLRSRWRWRGGNDAVVALTWVQALLCFVVLIWVSKMPYDSEPAYPVTPTRGYLSLLVSCILLFVAAMCFSVDVSLGSPQSRYTLVQKALVAPSNLTVWWLCIGGWIFMRLEEWNWSESLMFCLTSITTIGYGDVYPQKPQSRAACIAYVAVGIILLGYFLLSLRAVMVGHSSEILHVQLMGVKSLQEYSENYHQRRLRRAQIHLERQKREQALQSAAPTTEASSSSVLPLSRTLSNAASIFSTLTGDFQIPHRRLVTVQKLTSSGIFRMSTLLLVTWFGGASVFCLLEPDWTYLDAVYFVFCTQLTIGFGDIVPQTVAAQEFWYFYIVWGLVCTAWCLSVFGERLSEALQMREDDWEGSSEELSDESDSDMDQQPSTSCSRRWLGQPPRGTATDDEPVPVDDPTPSSSGPIYPSPSLPHKRASRRMSRIAIVR